MMQRTIIIFVAGMIILVGLFGISKPVTLKAGNCEANYTHYYITPYLSDTIPQYMVINNAKVDIVQCLCKDKDANEGTILQFYSEKDASSAKELGLDVSDICNNFRKTYPR